ncbi:hypothetical protein V494_04397 [Pseudogymnoascus sp. VKM F-4513 (FW-928)]|nr:hypothetical protein V494_04397 [Pseudogymnoascus sp. VKM F-4513 (FW-928)]
MSIILSNAPRLKPELRLAQAVSQFEASLSTKQKVTFRNYRSQSQDCPPDPSDVMRLTAEVDSRPSNKIGGGRCFGPRLTNFLQAVQQFAALGDIIMIGNFSSYMEKLSTLLMTAGHSAPRYQTMSLIYPRSKNLQSYMSEYFIVVVDLCHRMLKFTQKSALGQFASSQSDLDTKTYQVGLDHWSNAIKEEASLLMAKTIEGEAKDNSKFRVLSSKFSKIVLLQQKVKANLRILDSCSIYDYQTTWKQTRKIGNTTLFNRIDEYENWKAQNASCTLICTGGLGSGKSVLLANLIDDLHLDSRNKNVTVTYFFCRHDIPESLKARTVIGSLARQLLRPIADLAMMTGFIDKTATLALDFEMIFSLLERALPPKSKAYFVLDGLDECVPTEREILVLQLRKLQETFPLVLCISVRLDPGNVLKLSPERFIAAQIISIPDDNPDIDAFISAELESHIESKRLVIGDPLLILEIQDRLMTGSQGMFLWVALQIISLCDMKTDDAIRQALADLPKDLSETFSRILEKSDESGKSYQRRTLELVTAAHRPLTAEELRDALSVLPGDAVWNWSKRLNDVNSILTCCGSLLTIDEEERTIRLVHHSVKQFVLSGFKDSTNIPITLDGANRTMANIIVTYLNYGVFETQLSTTVVPQIRAASAPSQIIRSTADLSSSVQSLALKLLKSRKQPDFDIQRTIAETGKLFSSRSIDEFHFHSYAKLYWLQHILSVSEKETAIYNLLRRLFKGNVININTADKDGWTLPSLAARDGNEAILALLLDCNIVDANFKSGEGRTLLSWAAENGHEAVANMLLVKGADLDTEDASDQTPLSWAAENGHEEVVSLLLVNGAKIESRDGYGQTPLWWAARNGHATVLKLLLDAGANPEFETSGLDTPLSRAATNGHEAVVELLLNNGANVDSEYYVNSSRAPLISAAQNGHEQVVKLLLAKGANLEFADGAGQTPLSWAARNGNEEVVKLLLMKGANPKSKTIDGQTPLLLAKQNEHEGIVKLLSSIT